MKVCRRCLVSGRVQGVWFRGATRQQALELGLSGRARNLSDGRVEVLVSGEEAQVEALCKWLGRGPPMAKVDRVQCAEVEEQGFAGFETR